MSQLDNKIELIETRDERVRLGTTENRGRFHHYAGVAEQPGIEWIGTIEGPFDQKSLDRIDALIVSCDQHPPTRLAFVACKQLGIPTFHVLDGVIDWRTTFLNPKFDLAHGGVPLFQPLIADCVFTMGILQKWELQWLGNVSVNATGFPRFDLLERHQCRRGKPTGQARVLVATANSPWVTDEQKARVISEFTHLHQALHAKTFEGIAVKIIWRISDELALELGVTNCREGSAVEALGRCDAVITTPSTFAIEAMLTGLPTMIYDPFALPVFTPSAWQATSWETVIQLLPSLLRPGEPLAAYQDQILMLLVMPHRHAAGTISQIIQKVVHSRKHTGERGEGLANGGEASLLDPLKGPFAGSRWSPEQMGSLQATISVLDKTIAKLAQEYNSLQESHQNPTPRFVAGTIVRYMKGAYFKSNVKRDVPQ